MERVLEHSVLGRGRRRRAGRRVRYVGAENAEEAEEVRVEQLVGAPEEGDEEELECGAPLVAIPALDRRLASHAHAKRSPQRILKQERTRAVCVIFGMVFTSFPPFETRASSLYPTAFAL